MVDMEMLKSYAIGFGTFILAVAFVVIMTTNLQDQHLGSKTGVGVSPSGCRTAWNDTNCTTSSDRLLGNGTSLLGSMITTWGSIILLGIVVVAVFVGIFVALSYMSRGQGGR